MSSALASPICCRPWTAIKLVVVEPFVGLIFWRILLHILTTLSRWVCTRVQRSKKLQKSVILYRSLYSLIGDFLLSQIDIWTTTTWSNVRVILPKPSWDEFLIGFLVCTPASKYLHLTTFSNIFVILSMLLLFVNVSKCPKTSKLTNIVI